MQRTRTWRELLGELIRNQRERQRIAESLNVTQVTLNRWVQHESNPRQESLRRLLAVLPEYREVLLVLLAEEFPAFAQSIEEEASQEEHLFVPVEFYERVLHTLATLPPSLRFSSLCDLILQQVLEQLDPHRQGIAIMVACCMPPIEGKVRSLRERTGRGSSPWHHDLEQQGILLGAESLAGHALSIAHFEVNQALNDPSSRSPGYGATWEESAIAVPLLQLGRVAGSLLISSTQPHFFTSAHIALIERYAELLVLAFEATDFYELTDIDLALLPSHEAQLPFLATFSQRVAAMMMQAMKKGHAINYAQAQLLVWQQLEQNLLTGNMHSDENQ